MTFAGTERVPVIFESLLFSKSLYIINHRVWKVIYPVQEVNWNANLNSKFLKTEYLTAWDWRKETFPAIKHPKNWLTLQGFQSHSKSYSAKWWMEQNQSRNCWQVICNSSNGVKRTSVLLQVQNTENQSLSNINEGQPTKQKNIHHKIKQEGGMAHNFCKRGRLAKLVGIVPVKLL